MPKAFMKCTRSGGRVRTFGTGTITDSKSNTWVNKVLDFNFGTYDELSVWVSSTGNGGSGHTVTFTPQNHGPQLAALIEITGSPAPSLDQASAPATATGATLNVPSVTTLNANELLLAIYGSSGAITYSAPTNGFSLAASLSDTGSNITLGYASKVVAATGAYSTAVTQSVGTAYAAVMLSFIGSGAAAVGGPNPLFKFGIMDIPLLPVAWAIRRRQKLAKQFLRKAV